MCQQTFSSFRYLVLLLLASLFGSQESSSAPGDQAATLSSQEIVTDAEAKQFAHKIESAFEDSDAERFNRQIDWHVIANNAMEGLGASAAMKQSMMTGMLESLNGEQGFGYQLLKKGGNEASYKLLRLYEQEGIKHAIFRFTGDIGVNYHDFTLSKYKNGVKASSLFVFLSGELLSETMRRLLLPAVAEQNKNWLHKLTTSESDYVKHFDKVQRMISEFRSNSHAAALTAFYSLPPEVQKEKAFLLIRYQAAVNVSDDEIFKALQDYRKYHPKDVCLDFLLIDYHLLKKEFDKSLSCVDRLDEAVGGDGYLNLLRANILFEKGQKEQALEKMQQAIGASPTVIDAYWGMLELAMNLQDHPLTFQTLKQIEENFEMEWQDLRDVPEYADFVNSPEGQRWQTAHGFGSKQ